MIHSWKQKFCVCSNRSFAAARPFPSRVRHVQSVSTYSKSSAVNAQKLLPQGKQHGDPPTPTSRCYYNDCKQWRKNAVLVQCIETSVTSVFNYSPRVRLCVHAALLWVKFPSESVIFCHVWGKKWLFSVTWVLKTLMLH